MIYAYIYIHVLYVYIYVFSHVFSYDDLVAGRPTAGCPLSRGRHLATAAVSAAELRSRAHRRGASRHGDVGMAAMGKAYSYGTSYTS